MKLIQLKNGDWADPKTVTSILFSEAKKIAEFKWPHQVLVKHGGNTSTINCGSRDEANDVMIAIAKQVNAAYEGLINQVPGDSPTPPESKAPCPEPPAS